jgi:SpoVK/Ycf46/Vps4 family AAA+-type ATPase
MSVHHSISVKGPGLLPMWFGESEGNMREFFKKQEQHLLVYYSLISLIQSELLEESDKEIEVE